MGILLSLLVNSCKLTGEFRGGGNVINDDLDRRHPSFLWMSHEAARTGLKLNRSDVKWNWEELGSLHESFALAWQPLEHLPIKRLSYDSAEDTTWLYVYHFVMP